MISSESSFQIVTVGQLVRHLKSLVEDQKLLRDIMVRGEISDFSHAASGHLYFSLADEYGQIRCIMFRRYAQALHSFPCPGDEVILRGAVTVYERSGGCQLNVFDIQPAGRGKQRQELSALLQKLRGEGLFSPEGKRSLVRFPENIAVITSASGAAWQDIIRTFSLHNPLVRLHLYPALVQGPQAPASLMAALCQAEQDAIADTIIIARGGGSDEDLSAFNDEHLIRKVAACPIPVISAVGHEIDYTLLDLAADCRCATPTAACRAASISLEELSLQLSRACREIDFSVNKKLSELFAALDTKSALLDARAPRALLERSSDRLSVLEQKLSAIQRQKLDTLFLRLDAGLRQLDLLNPAGILRRGYSITTKDKTVITSCHMLSSGDRIHTQLADGTIISIVEKGNLHV